MQTVNGKFIVEEQSELESINQNVGNIAQQLEHLESQITAMSTTNKVEHLQKLTAVQRSLQKLERIYSRLASTALITAIGLVSWYVWLGFNYDKTPAKLANPKVTSTPMETGVSHESLTP
jgi:deoxyxylulose-5-phosphate synthase